MNSNFLYLGLLSPSVVDGLGNRRWYWSIHIFVFMCSNTRTILLGSNGLCVSSIFYCRAAFADDVEWYCTWPKESCGLNPAIMKYLTARRSALEKVN